MKKILPILDFVFTKNKLNKSESFVISKGKFSKNKSVPIESPLKKNK